MNYLRLLQCEEFTKDFIEFSFCEITGMTVYDEDKFEFVGDEFTLELIRFFRTKNITINEIANDPVSFEVNRDGKISEFFDAEVMFIELIENVYDYKKYS